MGQVNKFTNCVIAVAVFQQRTSSGYDSCQLGSSASCSRASMDVLVQVFYQSYASIPHKKHTSFE